MRNFSATLISGTNSVYIVGGYTSSASSPRNTVYDYNIASGTVTTKASLGAPICRHVAIYYNGNLYINGGDTTSGTDSQAEYTYNLAAGTTSSIAQGGFYLDDSTVVQAKDRFMYIGGTRYSIYLANITNFYFYNNVKDYGFSNRINSSRSGLGAAVLKGKAYAVGGRNAYGILPTVEMIDLGWEEKAAPPAPVSNYKSVSANGKLYVMGGQKQVGSSLQDSNTVFEYDSASNSWRQMAAAMPFYARNF